MDLLAHIAEDEEGCLRERMDDAALARQIAKADNHTAVSLFLQARHWDMLFAIILWRKRTGDSLRTAVDAVYAISEVIKKGEEIASA